MGRFILVSGVIALLVYAICGDPSPDTDPEFLFDRN